MKVLDVRLAGESLPIMFTTDLAAVEDWLSTQGLVAVDTETTGLLQFVPDFELRLVIIGNAHEALVVPVEGQGDRFRRRLGSLLAGHGRLVFHNATYDRLTLDAAGVLPLRDLTIDQWEDTRTQAHLLDPRAKQEGGTGHSLKDLADRWIDPAASAEGQAVLRDVFKEHGWSKDIGWREIPIDHPDYVRYGGLDALLTARLYAIQVPHIVDRSFEALYRFEKDVADLCARMEHRGVLVDSDYVMHDLLPHLDAMQAEGESTAAGWGVENVHSGAQVASALQGLGWEPAEFTATGKPKVDKAVLTGLAEAGNPIAAAVMQAKRAGKWASSYALPLLEQVDAQGRIHAKINALQARTARMSISSPPLQQLPSGDWRIRRAMVADPGYTIVACDYSAVEMKVLAALSGDRRMIEAIQAGVDLHSYTAELVFGPDFTPAHRKLAKGVGFGKVYGGGAQTISRQTGAPIADVQRAIKAYDAAYPGIRRLQRTLKDRAEVGQRAVTTVTGRVLPLDGNRLYAATNYLVQSTSRDVLAQALLDLDDAGLSEHLLLPIHDEVIAQAPTEDAAEVAEQIRRTMTMTTRQLGDTILDAEAQVYGPTWGHGYGAPS